MWKLLVQIKGTLSAHDKLSFGKLDIYAYCKRNLMKIQIRINEVLIRISLILRPLYKLIIHSWSIIFLGSWESVMWNSHGTQRKRYNDSNYICRW